MHIENIMSPSRNSGRENSFPVPSTRGNSFQQVLQGAVGPDGRNPSNNLERSRAERPKAQETPRDEGLKSEQDKDKGEERILKEKLEKLLSEKSVEDLKTSEDLEALENLEELKALLKKLSELAEEVQHILGELVEQEIFPKDLVKEVKQLMETDLSLESLKELGEKGEEKLSELLKILKKVTEESSLAEKHSEKLEQLTKAREEIKALVEEGLKKAALLRETTKGRENKPATETLSETEISKKEKESGKSEEEKGKASKAQGEKDSRIKAESRDERSVGKGEETLRGKANIKEEKTSKTPLTMETKEEQPLERNFLFTQDKVEHLEKLAAQTQRTGGDFGQNLSQMIEEMTEKISIMKNGEASEIKMQLVPNNLGKLLIQLSTDENLLSARVYADTPKVKEMIENQLEDLKEALIDKGLTVESLEVFVGQEQDRALYQKHGPMLMTGRNKSTQISFAEVEALAEEEIKSNPYMEKYQYNRLV